jgi:hypothetical protein
MKEKRLDIVLSGCLSFLHTWDHVHASLSTGGLQGYANGDSLLNLLKMLQN